MGGRKLGEKSCKPRNKQKSFFFFLLLIFFIYFGYRKKHPVLPQPRSEQQRVPPRRETELEKKKVSRRLPEV